jgi:hypothetical protein
MEDKQIMDGKNHHFFVSGYGVWGTESGLMIRQLFY